MEIGYAQIGGAGQEFNSSLNSLREKSNVLFKDKFYGRDLLEIHVGIICVAPEYDNFFKVGRYKYQKERKEYIKDSVEYVIEKTFEYNIKLDYYIYKSLEGEKFKETLISEILNSFQILKTPAIIKKIEDFDRDLFLTDLETLRHI